MEHCVESKYPDIAGRYLEHYKNRTFACPAYVHRRGVTRTKTDYDVAKEFRDACQSTIGISPTYRESGNDA